MDICPWIHACLSVILYDAVGVPCLTCVARKLWQVKAKNVSAEVIYKTRYVNMSREAVSACDIVPSALPSGEYANLPRVADVARLGRRILELIER